MAFASNSGAGPMADINVTPLVDVMLVLLIIFMITAPLMSHKVKVDLPQASLEQKPEIDQPPITLAIEASGQVYWNDEKISTDMLEARLAVLAQRHHDVVGAEDEVGHQGAVHDLVAAACLQRLHHGLQGGGVGGAFAQVVAEVGAQVLDVEARLGQRVVPGHQLIEPRAPHHQHGLAFIGVHGGSLRVRDRPRQLHGLHRRP